MWKNGYGPLHHHRQHCKTISSSFKLLFKIIFPNSNWKINFFPYLPQTISNFKENPRFWRQTDRLLWQMLIVLDHSAFFGFILCLLLLLKPLQQWKKSSWKNICIFRQITQTRDKQISNIDKTQCEKDKSWVAYIEYKNIIW